LIETKVFTPQAYLVYAL